MAKMDWQELLGWSDEQLEELRFSGFSFLRQGHYPKAILFFKALCILAPQSAYDLQTLGALYLQTGSALKALSFLDRALQIDPEHEPTLLNKVKALLMNHEVDQALTLARTLTKSTESTIRNNAMALIESHS